MTGTARSSARELKKIYKLNVVAVPTNRPVIRQELPIRTYANSEAKWQAIVDEIRQLHAEGRPVLVGTRSIDKSEILSRLLQAEKIDHQVLNAHHVAAEADIVAQAGRKGTVTIATNMAGRGTDILLGGNPEYLAWDALSKRYRQRLDVPPEQWQETVQRIRDKEHLDSEREEIVKRGGLHVICTEWHESQRIDRQLIGRCGRQGDPGTYRRYAALDDEILSVGFGPKRANRWQASHNGSDQEVAGMETKFRRAQRRIERRHFRGRKSLMYHEKLRKKVQKQMGQDPYLDTPT